MFTKKEVFWIILSIILMAFIASFLSEFQSFLKMLLFSFIVIGSSIMGKKLAAKYTDIKIEHKIWYWQRWGVYERSYFKKPIPIGLLLPFILSLMSTGLVKAYTFLQFDFKGKKSRVAKKRSIYRFTDVTEWDVALIVLYGFIATIALAIIGLIIKQPELAKLSIYYTIWNLLPLGQLDGTKLFFGSLLAWILTTISALIVLGILIITLIL